MTETGNCFKFFRALGGWEICSNRHKYLISFINHHTIDNEKGACGERKSEKILA